MKKLVIILVILFCVLFTTFLLRKPSYSFKGTYQYKQNSELVSIAILDDQNITCQYITDIDQKVMLDGTYRRISDNRVMIILDRQEFEITLEKNSFVVEFKGTSYNFQQISESPTIIDL